MSEKRGRPRGSVSGDLKIHWNDEAGNFFNLSGAWSDLSELGGGLYLKRRIKPGTSVKIESPWLRQSGLAVVRHCAPAGAQFRMGLEFVSGTRGQPSQAGGGQGRPADREADTCPYCHSPLAQGQERCLHCGRTPLPPRRCAMCGFKGHPNDVNTNVVNGFEQGSDARQRSWPVHSACLQRQRGEVWISLSILRCPQCSAEVELGSQSPAELPRPGRCPQCGSQPETIEAGWRKRAHSCLICSLPVYDLIHAVWPVDNDFLHAVHAICADRLGLQRPG
jgi:hypothetical protein